MTPATEHRKLAAIMFTDMVATEVRFTIVHQCTSR